MSITGIIMAAVIVSGTGLFIGIFLGLADKKLTVKVDEKEEAIRRQRYANDNDHRLFIGFWSGDGALFSRARLEGYCHDARSAGRFVTRQRPHAAGTS